MGLRKKDLLRLFLAYTAIGWGVTIIGVFLPSSSVADVIQYIGGVDASEIMKIPMFDYWFRMAASVFGLIGIFYLILALNSEKYIAVMPLAAFFMLAECAVLFTAGIVLRLQPVPWLGDTLFCFLGGMGILLTMKMK